MNAQTRVFFACNLSQVKYPSTALPLTLCMKQDNQNKHKKKKTERDKTKTKKNHTHKKGATRGVTVSMSAFLACHQCYCAGSSLAWGLNLRAVVCGIF